MGRKCVIAGDRGLKWERRWGVRRVACRGGVFAAKSERSGVGVSAERVEIRGGAFWRLQGKERSCLLFGAAEDDTGCGEGSADGRFLG